MVYAALTAVLATFVGCNTQVEPPSYDLTTLTAASVEANSKAPTGNASQLMQTWPEGGPQQVWLYRQCGHGYSKPTIVGKRLYIMGARDGQEMLLALSTSDSSELWSAPIGTEYINDWGDGPRGAVVVDGDRLYALGAQGNLICVSAADGNELWRKSMTTDLGGKVPVWGYSETPLIDGARILCTPGGPQGAIACLDKTTGEVLWQSKELTDVAHYSSLITASPHGNDQYIQLLEKRLVGLDKVDGTLLWESSWPGRVAVIPTPYYANNQVYITSGYGVGCKLVEIDPENNVTEIYANKVMKNHHGGIEVLNGHVYGHSDKTGWTCQDLKTGDRIWTERRALDKGAVEYADGRLYCLEKDTGTIALVEPSPTGWQEHGRFTMSPQSNDRKDKGRIWAHPVIADGKLYLRDQELLFCFDVAVE